jgi:hypothetical protein
LAIARTLCLFALRAVVRRSRALPAAAINSKHDFEKAGDVSRILGRYAPPSIREFAASGNYEIKYIPYNWGLSDQGSHGRNYSRTRLLLDHVFK